MENDAELLRAARTDSGAFRALYDRYAEPMRRSHLARKRDPETALDADAAGHRPGVLGGPAGRRLPLRPHEADREPRGRRPEGNGRADRRRHQARQRRLPCARLGRRTWQCYIGRAAVEQKIIGPGFLGEYAPSPGVG
jgi:hypothetical protein